MSLRNNGHPARFRASFIYMIIGEFTNSSKRYFWHLAFLTGSPVGAMGSSLSSIVILKISRLTVQ